MYRSSLQVQKDTCSRFMVKYTYSIISACRQVSKVVRGQVNHAFLFCFFIKMQGTRHRSLLLSCRIVFVKLGFLGMDFNFFHFDRGAKLWCIQVREETKQLDFQYGCTVAAHLIAAALMETEDFPPVYLHLIFLDFFSISKYQV